MMLRVLGILFVILQGVPAVSAAPEPVVAVVDRVALDWVESHGGSFENLIGIRRGPLLATLAADLKEIQRADSKAGVAIKYPHRLFNAAWLESNKARFELIAVMNRMDRAPFTPGECGEFRLLYRLGYDKNGLRSRLPMTVVLALRAPKDCQAFAKTWQVPTALSGEALGKWLLASPLGQGRLIADRVARVEVNMQTIRWPSAVRPDLGGHAEYLMRVFHAGPALTDPFVQAPLLTTPDVARIKKDPARIAALKAWIKANLASIDAGTAILPDDLSARRIFSVTPRGSSRRANRPYRELLAAKEFSDVDFSGLRHVKSPEALLRRLDDQTCVGCHQARTIAGFHLLGEDRPDVVAGNALFVSSSPHVADELARRKRLVSALATGSPPDWSRPFAEHSLPGTYGARCGLGDPGFAGWTCNAGLTCQPYDAPADDRTLGVCLAKAPEVGDPCQFAPLQRDRQPKSVEVECDGDAVCNTNRVGFPGGMCTSSCGSGAPHAVCGAIALLTPFNNCIARGEPFSRCIATHVAPAGLRGCDATRPCREDYICAKTAKGEGACIPPYFLFQLRVDGHPSL